MELKRATKTCNIGHNKHEIIEHEKNRNYIECSLLTKKMFSRTQAPREEVFKKCATS